MLKNISQENMSPPGVACNIVETVDRKACMAVARASSTSNVASQRDCGDWASKSVFNTVVMSQLLPGATQQIISLSSRT